MCDLLWCKWLVQRFRSERLRGRSQRSATYTPSAHVRRQSLPVWPPTLNKIPLLGWAVISRKLCRICTGPNTAYTEWLKKAKHWSLDESKITWHLWLGSDLQFLTCIFQKKVLLTNLKEQRKRCTGTWNKLHQSEKGDRKDLLLTVWCTAIGIWNIQCLWCHHEKSEEWSHVGLSWVLSPESVLKTIPTVGKKLLW